MDRPDNIEERIPPDAVAQERDPPVRSDGAEVRVRYKVDEAVSDWLQICCGESLHGVDAAGTLHALAGRYRKVLSDDSLTIILR